MEGRTLNQILYESLARYARPDLLRYKQAGAWRTISTDTFLCGVAAVGQALAKLGVRRGDRVGLFSENRPEWHIADFAVLGLGAIDVPVYPSESAERLRYILNHSEARLCFVSNADQLEKVLAVWKELPALETVVSFADAKPAAAPGRVLAWSELARDDLGAAALADFKRVAEEAMPGDVATLIYTSGTTGVPKGVLLTQNNFASNILALVDVLPCRPDYLALSLLPLCHIFERTNAYHYFYHGVSIAYAESFDHVVQNLLELRPHLMAAVPRFFEKFYAGVQARVQRFPPLARRLFEWGVSVGREALPYRLERRPMPAWLAARYRLADWIVFRRVRAEVGGRIHYFISGGAPLSRGINEYLHCVGLSILEGYGLTETSPVISVNSPAAVRLGTVGRPLPGVEVRIAEDGEILSRGPHIMKGYYKMEEETREALRDGWFHTGDIGVLDDAGFLAVTDRKKDLIKTAGGKYVAPQPIENRLKQSPYIQSAVVLGDKQRFVAALLVPDFATLERWAAGRGVNSNSRAALLARPEVRELYDAEVEKVNRDLAQFEKLKRYALLEKEFSFDGGQLTYTQKIRRRQIEEQYRELLARLYAEETRVTT